MINELFDMCDMYCDAWDDRGSIPDEEADAAASECDYYLADMNEEFKLPIYYNESKVELNPNIVNDLELVETMDPSCNNVYSFVLDCSYNPITTEIVNQVSRYYTSDTRFLKDYQSLLKTYKPIPKTSDKHYNKILSIWRDIKGEDDFKNKYCYIDWQCLEFINQSDVFLQILSIFNIASPLFSFCVPIFILIVPFFIIQFRGVTLSFTEYFDILKGLVADNAIARLFTDFNEVKLQDKAYLLISAFFYVFSIYQNIQVCVRFNRNMYKIHSHFREITQYLSSTIDRMENYLEYSSRLPSQQRFNEILLHNKKSITEFKNNISAISEYKLSVSKFCDIGHVLKYFYQLYNDPLYNSAFLYSFGFNGYIDFIEGLSNSIEDGSMNLADLLTSEETRSKKHSKKKRNKFVKSYYAPLKHSSPTKNTVLIDKSFIISGPNAAGKTTIIKSTLINIILSQQFGCGFYESAKLKPYHHIHCYLNIPDTSGRDSLFQAEARRCKEILDFIKDNKRETHFCVFDELYSGTNPDEAVVSAIAFLEYLVKNKNVTCILTTHFRQICNKFEGHDNVVNNHMDVTKDLNNRITYKYLLKPGISDVKGGINVLSDMNYPKEIIENSIKYGNKMC
jgi:hypothetical protein